MKKIMLAKKYRKCYSKYRKKQVGGFVGVKTKNLDVIQKRWLKI